MGEKCDLRSPVGSSFLLLNGSRIPYDRADDAVESGERELNTEVFDYLYSYLFGFYRLVLSGGDNNGDIVFPYGIDAAGFIIVAAASPAPSFGVECFEGAVDGGEVIHNGDCLRIGSHRTNKYGGLRGVFVGPERAGWGGESCIDTCSGPPLPICLF